MTTTTQMGGNSVWTNTKGIMFADGTVQGTAFIEPAGSKTIYVDGNRTNVYVADGSYLRPFKTIMGAVNQVIANGDNSQSVPYVIEIFAGTYVETIDLSNPLLSDIFFNGSNGVYVGDSTLTAPVLRAVNNDNLSSVTFTNVIFSLNGTTTHGIEFSSTTVGSTLGNHGIIFRTCGVQDNVSDVYFNNVSFVVFDNTGVTANINAVNVNEFNFVNSNGPNPQTPFSIVSDLSSPTPFGWVGYSSAEFTGVSIGSITTDANSKVGIESCLVNGLVTDAATVNAFVVLNSVITGSIVVNAGGILGLVNCLVSQPAPPAVSTVTVNGVLLSAFTIITGTAITVNSGGAFVESGGQHDDGSLTVNSGGEYGTEGTFGIDTLNVFTHINTVQQDLAGTITISGGTSASFTFAAPYSSSPIVVVTPTESEPGIGFYWVTPTPEGFTVNCTNSGTCTFNYIVIGTAF